MTRWLRRLAPRPDAERRLVCCPFAGGGAHAFRSWCDRLPRCEVWGAVLPGHVGRLNEPLPTDLVHAADEIADGIVATLAPPVVLYGHSMGAWLALEIARSLERRGSPPAGLVVAGRNGPGYPEDVPPLSRLPDADFIHEVSTRYGGVSPEVAANAEIMELFLPVLRADIGMMERYDPSARALPLRCPVLACTGSSDPGTTAAGLEEWATVTEGQFEVATLPGDHFFMDQHPGDFFRLLAGWIDRLR